MATETKQSAEERAIERFADLMIDKINSINEDWKQPWFTNHYKTTPVNIAGRPYNGMNYFVLQLMCDLKDYATPCFLTHARIQAFNYDKNGERLKDKDGKELPYVSVIKGEKSFPVFLTIFNVRNKDTKERISYDEYVALDGDDKDDYQVFPNLKTYNVFNLDQTNLKDTRPEIYNKLLEQYGKSKPVPTTGKKFHFDVVDNMIANNKWFCPIETSKKDDAKYSPVLDRIQVPDFKLFKTGEAFYSTVFHEMAHSTGHESRLNRADGMTAKYGTKEYGKEELTAEMTAALVCHTYGFDNGIKKESATYLKGWCKLIKEEPNYIKSVLLDVKRAYAKITDRIAILNK